MGNFYAQQVLEKYWLAVDNCGVMILVKEKRVLEQLNFKRWQKGGVLYIIIESVCRNRYSNTWIQEV